MIERMIKMIYLTSICIFIITAHTYATELTVEIKTTPDQNVLPMEVEFEALVSGGVPPYVYTWNFGDGGTSVLREDSHYYKEVGQYTVIIMVFDSEMNSTISSKQISISSSVFNLKNAVFKTFTNTNTVEAIVQNINDSNILWLGTTGGLVRYNFVTGEKKTYIEELPYIYIVTLLQTLDGAIWAASSRNGLARFDYASNEWTIYDTSNSGLPSNRVHSLFQTTDRLVWVGTEGGLARLDYASNEWTVYDTSNSGLPDNNIWALLQTTDGAVWAGTPNGGLARFDYASNDWTIYNISNSGLPSNRVGSLLQTTDGLVWAGTEGGLARFDYASNEWTVYDTSNSGLPSNSVRSLLQATDGSVWAGTPFGGLARYDYTGNDWTIYDISNSGLASDSVDSLLQATDGSVWAGTGDGLARFDYASNEWKNHDISNNGLPDNWVDSLLQATDGSVWAGAGRGLVRYDYASNQWRIYDTSNSGLPENYVFSLLQAFDEALWVGTYNGLARLDYANNKWTIYDPSNSGLPGNWVFSLLQATDGLVWAGTEGGLARFDHASNEWTIYDPSNSGLPAMWVKPLIQAKDGVVWAGTYGGGLVRFDYANNEWTIYDSSNSELPHNHLDSLLKSIDGSIWAGTFEGLARFDYANNEWTIYDSSNSGLPGNRVQSLLQTTDGSIWAGTYGGLARFDYASNEWTVYDTFNSGLPDIEIWSLLQTMDGAVWAGTFYGGLCRISFLSSLQSPGRLVLIAGGGAAKTNPLWPTTNELALSNYRTFISRGYRNTDIMLLSPEKWADFNGDGFDDHVVDRPRPHEDRDLTVEDIQFAITEWAVNTYTEGTPLFISLIDHGFPDDGLNGPYFQIAPGQLLYADALDDMISTYEQKTGGQVVILNESCYSGQFLSRLNKTNRIIITASGDHIVNYDNWGANSFTHHFLRYLFENNSLYQAFAKSKQRIKNSNLTADQTPQIDDNGDGKFDQNDGLIASNIKLGGDFNTGAPWPQILSVAQTGKAGDSASFSVTVNAHMRRVWASVQPPGYIPDNSGSYQDVNLEKFDLWDNDGDLVYEGNYKNFTETGDYVLTFYARDQFGNVAVSDPLTVPIAAAGDVNGDGEITLADAITALIICSDGSVQAEDLNVGASIGPHANIGLMEAVYVLQKVSGKRDLP